MKFEKLDPSKRVNAGSTDRAVSPVIGVILMVAITVILAAVIGVFVMGLGDEIGNTAPTVTLEFADGNSGTANFYVEHTGGDSLDTEELSVIVDGSTDDAATLGGSGTLQSGENVTVTGLNVAATDGDYTPGSAYDVTIRHDPSGTTLAEGNVVLEDDS